MVFSHKHQRINTVFCNGNSKPLSSQETGDQHSGIEVIIDNEDLFFWMRFSVQRGRYTLPSLQDTLGAPLSLTNLLVSMLDLTSQTISQRESLRQFSQKMVVVFPEPLRPVMVK